MHLSPTDVLQGSGSFGRADITASASPIRVPGMSTDVIAETPEPFSTTKLVFRATCGRPVGHRHMTALSKWPGLGLAAHRHPRNAGRQGGCSTSQASRSRSLVYDGYAENATFPNSFFNPGMEMIIRPFAAKELAIRTRDMIEHRL